MTLRYKKGDVVTVKHNNISEHYFYEDEEVRIEEVFERDDLMPRRREHYFARSTQRPDESWFIEDDELN